ncbi:IclR family transcriptional regulator C-terminal domain-containing protein [Tistrella bauzanensis]
MTGEDALVEHLHEIRRQGYATAIGENLTGIDSVGAVVRGSNGQVAGAISAAYAPTLQPGIRFDELTSRIVEAARDISLRLGCPASALPGEARSGRLNGIGRPSQNQAISQRPGRLTWTATDFLRRAASRHSRSRHALR